MVDSHVVADFSVNLTGKVAVVLGASAEGGTGWAVAEALAAQGAKVVVGARTMAPLKVLADRIGGLAVACDAGIEAQVKALAKAALDTYGHVEIAVNSAGRAITTSIAACSSDQIVEACAKAASDCLVRYAAMEYGPRGIRINSILPGTIKSDMSRRAFDIPGFEEAQAQEVPLGRVGYPADFANAVLWLAGPAFVTGLNLQVSGGNQLTRLPAMLSRALEKGAPGFDMSTTVA